IKSKSKARKIQSQRGVVKARGGGPATKHAQLAGQALNTFFNPFPEAAAFQAPLKLAWKTVLGEGGKAVINPRTKKPLRKANVALQPTEGAVEVFEGGMPGILGTPIGTGQYPISFVKTGDKIVKKVGKKKVFTSAVAGDAAETMRPDMNPYGYASLVKPGGEEDFAAAGAWWSDYTKLVISGKVEKGTGQPGYGKGGVGPSEQQKSQPGWYTKPKAGQGEYKVSSKAGDYRVMAGKGKTKTWIGGSTRLEGGSQPGGAYAFKQWFDKLLPSEQTHVKKTFLGEGGLYKSVLDSERGARWTGKSKPPKPKPSDMNVIWKTLTPEVQTQALGASSEAQRLSYQKWGFRGMNPTDKKSLLKKAGIDFE
ncbi:MAG: hypothetical protein CME69_09940, partial [Halobacteriovorax sp.]|nr:hypothetical protein [Halobacteriovorax sp.]